MNPALFVLAAAVALAGEPSGRLLLGFEHDADLEVFEAVKGPALAASPMYATEGSRSLLISSSSYLYTGRLPGDWRGYEEFAFDAFNATNGVVVVSVLVGDRAWKEKGGGTYWNRHNSEVNVAPGASRVSLPVEGLFRGEPGSRNNDIKRNIDPGEIVRLDLGFAGPPGAVYLDAFRLVKGSRPPSVRAFDFGPESQTVWPGFTPVTWNTVYTKDRGFGLSHAFPHSNWARDDTFPTRLYQDWVWLADGDFRVDLPNGRYQVRVVFADCGYWGGEYARHTVRTISAEGKEAVREDRGDRGGDWEALHLFEDVEVEPGRFTTHLLSDFPFRAPEAVAMGPPGVAPLYFDKLFRPREFEVEVADGQLNLAFKADAPWSVKVAAVEIWPAVDREAQAWVNGIEAANRREFEARATEIRLPDPAGLSGYGYLPEAAGYRGWVRFAPGLEETVYANAIPKRGAPVDPVPRDGARGEDVPFTFAIRPLRRIDRLAVQCDGLRGPAGEIPASAVTVRSVLHLAKRGYNTIRWKLTPWWLRDDDGYLVKERTTRQFLVTVRVPKDAAPGRYEGAVRLSEAGGQVDLVPLVVEVLPFELDAVEFPVGFYGMQKDWLGYMREYGMTTVSGGPNIRFIGFDAGSLPRIDFAAVDDYMDAIRAAGYTGRVLSYGGPANLEDVRYEGIEAVFAEWGKPAKLTAAEAGRRVFGAIKAHAKEKNWLPFVFAMADEPRVRDQTERILASIAFLRKVAPWLTLAGSYSVDHDPKDPVLTHALFRVLDVSLLNDHDAAILAEGKRLKKDVLIYNQGRDRYTFGAYLWSEKTKGVKGFLQWHMFATHGYQFFDLDGREPDDGVIMVTTRGLRPTLDLERVRMGLTDFRYFATLDRLASGAKGPNAAAARKVLASFVSRLKVGERPRPDWLDLDALRAEAAAAIQALSR